MHTQVTRKNIHAHKRVKKFMPIPNHPPLPYQNTNGPPLKEQCVQLAHWRESSIILAGKLAAVQIVVIMAFGKLPVAEHLACSKGKSCRSYSNERTT